jgi:hypothetical protein
LSGETRNNLSILSIGLPPERHADRVVAGKIGHMAKERARFREAVADIMRTASDGGPRAQQKLARRIANAGAFNVTLKSGKRGRYSIIFSDLSGWDPGRDAEIGPSDAIPPKPWIAANVNMLISPGRGAGVREVRGAPAVLVSHHAASRYAQRFNLRDDQQIWDASVAILEAALALLNKELEKENPLANPPPQGWRIPLSDGAVVVLKRHDRFKALIAATVF